MATDIQITDLTDGVLSPTDEWVGSGIFDKLIAAVNSNIEGQFNKGRIKGADYANVYLGSIQSVLQQSLQYVLQEKQTEAQVDLTIVQKEEMVLNGASERALQAAQLAIAQKELLLKEAELNIKLKELEIRTYEFSQMLPLQKIKLESDITVTDAQVVGISKDNLVKDEQVLMSVFERTVVQPKELEKLQEEVSLTYVTRGGKDKEVASMGLDSVVKVGNTSPEAVYTPKYEVI